MIVSPCSSALMLASFVCLLLLWNTPLTAARSRWPRRELQGGGCIDNPQQYESILLIKHVGKSSDVSTSDLLAIEEGIKKAWNSLYACEINITSVTADLNNLRDMKHTATHEFEVPYRILGACSECLNNQGGILFGRGPEPHSSILSRNYPSFVKASGGNRRRVRVRSKREEDETRRNLVFAGSTSSSSYSPSSRSNRGGDNNGRDPQEAHLLAAVNNELIERRSGLSADYTAMDLVEAKAMPCSSESSSFVNTLVLELESDGADLLFEEKLQEMQRLFYEEYNWLTFLRCDDIYFRTLDGAVVVERLMTSGQVSSRKPLAKVTALASCHGCDGNMFGNHREEQTQLPMESQCFCSYQRESPVGAPDFETFQYYYNKQLREFNLDTFDLGHQVEELQCNSTEERLETTLLLEVDKLLSSITEDDIQDLVDNFQRFYNKYLFAACDFPFFRSITNVTIESLNNRWLGTQPFPSWLDRERLLKMNIQYNSRVAGEPLFDMGTEELTIDLSLDHSPSQEIQPNDGSCFCEFQTSKNYVPVSPNAFNQLFISTLDVKDLLEVEEYECDPNTMTRNTQLFILFDSAIFNSTLVEQQMVTVANNLAFKMCDPLFRTLLDLSLTFQNETVWTASASYECRNCENTASLFSWRNELPVETASINFKDFNMKAFEKTSNACYCPVNARLEDRAPTETEFAFALDASLSATGVQDIVEVRQLECSSQRYGFQTEIYLLFNTDVSSLEKDVLVDLASSFEKGYNSLQFHVCDEVSRRRVLNVELDVSNSTENNLLRAVVDVECGGDCTVETTLFSDVPSDEQFTNSSLSLPSSPLLETLAADDACLCSSSFPLPLGRSPTTQEFLSKFNSSLLLLQESAGTSPDIEQVIEVKSVDCPDAVVEFSAIIAMRLQGTVDQLTSNEKSILEDTFKDRYNALSFSQCDSLFRVINDVTINVNPQFVISQSEIPISRQGGTLDLGNATTPVNATTQSDLALYTVVGECRDCAVSAAGTFNLFDDAFRRRRNKMTRHLQSQVSGCLCPSNTNPTKPDAPTEGEFLDEYNGAVEQLKDSGALVNVDGAVEIESCDLDVTEVAGIYDIFVAGEGFDPNPLLVLTAFNAIRTGACSSQVIRVDVVDDAQQDDNAWRVEVIAVFWRRKCTRINIL